MGKPLEHCFANSIAIFYGISIDVMHLRTPLQSVIPSYRRL
jgi:hypothetical protein